MCQELKNDVRDRPRLQMSSRELVYLAQTRRLEVPSARFRSKNSISFSDSCNAKPVLTARRYTRRHLAQY